MGDRNVVLRRSVQKERANMMNLKRLDPRDEVLVREAQRTERNRCAGMVSTLADLMRGANRKKFAAELDMLARDIQDPTLPNKTLAEIYLESGKKA